MPIRFADLHTRLLRASFNTTVGAALKPLANLPGQAGWLLLIALEAGGYAVLGLDDLAQRSAGRDNRLDIPMDELNLVSSPIVDADEDLEAARAQTGTTGYAVVLRDGQVLGVLAAAPVAPATAEVQQLLQQAAMESKEPVILGLESEAAQPAHPHSDRYVNTDFATEQAPGQALAKTIALQPGTWYFFRLNVGELEPSSIEATPEQLPEFLLDQAIDVMVVLFSESFEIEQSTGVLHVPAIGAATVQTRAAAPESAGEDLLNTRLLFRVRTPPRIGRADLRVNLYWRGMLIQSRLVTAVVGRGRPLDETGTMRVSALEFNLSPALAPRHLTEVAPHKLSMMVNANGDGTHAFRLVGGDGAELFQNSVTLPAGELADLIEQARWPLRKVAWGTIDDWDGKAPYRYEASVDAQTRAKNFQQDLFDLAAQGARLYGAIYTALGGGRQGAAQLQKLMRQPGMVQMASKISANDVVPMAMFYDAPIMSQAGLTLCPTFEASLASGRDLLSEPCFLGNCPSYGNQSVVCPSGFWGFRHDIGMPWPAPYGPEMATAIKHGGTPLIDIAFYTFPKLGGHLDTIGQIGYQTQRQNTTAPAIQMFQQTQPQIVYFYCHGVLKDNTIPYLRIGAEATRDYIEPDNFRNIFQDFPTPWSDIRPLVMINGCHTTALSPEHAISFVKSFVENADAAGVIGTEITIFEPLAQRFAETFLKLFFGGEPLGRAIRRARLQLLADRNPLGLVYDPFAYAGLKLISSQ